LDRVWRVLINVTLKVNTPLDGSVSHGEKMRRIGGLEFNLYMS